MADNKESKAGCGCLIIGAIVVVLFMVGLAVPQVRIGVGCIGNPYFTTYQGCFNLESQGFHSTKDSAQAKDAQGALDEAQRFSESAIDVARQSQDGTRIAQSNQNDQWSSTSDYERAMANREQYCENEYYVMYSTDDRRWTWLVNAKAAATQFGVTLPSPPPGNQGSVNADSSTQEPEDTAQKPHTCLDGHQSVRAPHDPRDYSGYDGPEDK